MGRDKVKIEIPEEGGVKIDPGAKIDSEFKSSVVNRFDKIDALLFAIVTSVIVSVVAVIIAVVGLFIDQMRFNSAAYKEYSEKITISNSLKDSNNELLNQNKQNQELILKQQSQILKLIKK